MRKLYYATFEKGYSEIVEKYIKKQDKNSHIKRIYPDSVLFYANEKFAFENSLFVDNFHVLDEWRKEGSGTVNAFMKHILERKNFRLVLPGTVKKLKITFSRYSEKLLIDQKLRLAFETMISKSTKRQVGYLGADSEIVLLFKQDGLCLLMFKETKVSELSNLDAKFGISPRAALCLNFLSEPAENEVSIDPYADSGLISYTRSLCFKRANIIANEEDETKIPTIKKLARTLKERAFSILNYDFTSEIFPLRFIDKIVSFPPQNKEKLAALINKAYTLKVKKMVLMVSSIGFESLIKGKFVIQDVYVVGKNKIYVLNLEK